VLEYQSDSQTLVFVVEDDLGVVSVDLLDETVGKQTFHDCEFGLARGNLGRRRRGR